MKLYIKFSLETADLIRRFEKGGVIVWDAGKRFRRDLEQTGLDLLLSSDRIYGAAERMIVGMDMVHNVDNEEFLKKLVLGMAAKYKIPYRTAERYTKN